MVASLPCPKSYSGFRRCVAKLVLGVARKNPKVGVLRARLMDTGFEAGSFLNEIFYAWDSFRLEGMGVDAWVLAWEQVHDAFINAVGGGEELSRLLMDCCPAYQS